MQDIQVVAIWRFIKLFEFPEYKCDPNILDEDGRTALHLCAVETSLPTKEECAKLLYSVTDTQIVDKFGRKAI